MDDYLRSTSSRWIWRSYHDSVACARDLVDLGRRSATDHWQACFYVLLEALDSGRIQPARALVAPDD